MSPSSSTDLQQPTATTTYSQLDPVKNNQTTLSVNDIIQNTEIKFNDIFGPIIITSLVVSAILFTNSSNRLDTNIKDIEKLEPRETKKSKIK